MLNKSDLIKYFENGIKNTSEIKIGTEHEKFIYHKSDLSLVPYSGDVSINSIFEDFIQDGWRPVIENENIIALNKDRASITLEPGGQFELSGAPLKTIHETCKEINNHLAFTKKLEEKYKNAIANHNSNVDNCFPDSGFDLFLPIEFSPEKKTEKIDYNIKAAMFKTISSLLVRPENQNALSFDIHEPMPYYLYPRSSISKTRVRLANNVGIIDSGYRGNIGAYFDVELPNAQTSTEPETVLEKHQRVLQICSNDLSPFKVILIKNIGNLGATERGQGGFGSTGI